MEAKFQCPKCERPVVSRRNKLCQYCGATLPQHLLWTPSEIEIQDRLLAEKEHQRKANATADKQEDLQKNPTDGLYVHGDFDATNHTPCDLF